MMSFRWDIADLNLPANTLLERYLELTLATPYSGYARTFDRVAEPPPKIIGLNRLCVPAPSTKLEYVGLQGTVRPYLLGNASTMQTS